MQQRDATAQWHDIGAKTGVFSAGGAVQAAEVTSTGRLDDGVHVTAGVAPVLEFDQPRIAELARRRLPCNVPASARYLLAVQLERVCSEGASFRHDNVCALADNVRWAAHLTFESALLR
eukprot:1255788-Rhodomonas_salina.2